LWKLFCKGLGDGIRQWSYKKERIRTHKREAALQIQLQQKAHQQHLKELAYLNQLQKEHQLLELAN